MTQSPPPEYERGDTPSGSTPAPEQFLPTQPLPPQPIPLEPTVAQPVSLAPPVAPVPPAKPSLNVFAVVSLITGICGGLLLSVIFAIVALVQIRRTGQRGKGLAIGGLAISGGYLVAGAIVIALLILTGAQRDSSGVITKAGPLPVDDLRVGDCIAHVDLERGVRSVPAVPCAQSHESEVVAVFDVAGSQFPGGAALQEQAESGCQDLFSSYAPAGEADQYTLVYFMPSSETWRRGDREVVCLAYQPGVLVTGSIRD